jgi:hypothetical protein
MKLLEKILVFCATIKTSWSSCLHIVVLDKYTSLESNRFSIGVTWSFMIARHFSVMIRRLGMDTLAVPRPVKYCSACKKNQYEKLKQKHFLIFNLPKIWPYPF